MLQITGLKSTIAALLKKIQPDSKPMNTCGLYIHEETLSIAITEVDKDAQVTSIQLRTDHFKINDKFSGKLRLLREALQLTGRSVHWVISKNNYQTLLIDRPDVKPNEYRAAALWQAKDLLKFPLEDCVVDVFLPSKRVGIHEKKLYLVVAKRSWVTNIVEGFDRVDMPIDSIITEEFALRNVLYQLINNATTSVLMRHDDGGYLFMVIGDGDILFTRHISENVVTELYRSAEFYSVTLKQDKLDSLFMINIDEQTQADISGFFLNYEYDISLKTVDALYQKYQVDPSQCNLPGLLAIGGVFAPSA